MMNGYDKLLFKLLCWIIFQCGRLVFCAVQKINWTLNGTHRQLEESRLDKNNDKCVQVMDIVTYHSCDALTKVSRRDFLLTHNRFESPDYVIRNSHVTLLDIEDETAIFVESLPEKHLWRSEVNSFYKAAQVKASKSSLRSVSYKWLNVFLFSLIQMN